MIGELGMVGGFTVLYNPNWEPGESRFDGPYGVRTASLKTPGNYWPNAFFAWHSQDDVEQWIRDVLVPSVTDGR